MTATAFVLPDFVTTPTPATIVRDAIRGAVTPRLTLVKSDEPQAQPMLTFREFVDRVNPRYRWYDHCVRAAAVLQRVADGELDRVIICWPPRHGKTELATKLFAAYLVYRYPEQWTAIGSYGANLANKMSRAARDYATIGGAKLRGDASAVSEWETEQGGGVWSAGVGGPATGKGFRFGLLDDPIKDAKEASSQLIAERLQEWYGAVWYSRQEPDAALVVNTTRWPGLGDFVGFLLTQESGEDEQHERWHLLIFEAEKSATPHEIPPTCTLEPDPREPGEPLCPQRYPIARIRKVRAKIGSYFFESLYQQRKSHRQGRMFQYAWFKALKDTPHCTSLRRYWDLAGTEPKKKGHNPDYTATSLLGRMDDLKTCVLDNEQFRESVMVRDQKIEEIARADRARYGIDVVWWFEQETGVGGAERTAAIVRRVQSVGLTVHVEPATGNKLLRAEPLASAAEAGNVVLAPENGHRWHDRFCAHMAEFSSYCEHDDTADATAGAYNKLSEPEDTVSFHTMSM